MSLLWLSPSYSNSKPNVQMDVPWTSVPAILQNFYSHTTVSHTPQSFWSTCYSSHHTSLLATLPTCSDPPVSLPELVFWSRSDPGHHTAFCHPVSWGLLQFLVLALFYMALKFRGSVQVLCGMSFHLSLSILHVIGLDCRGE